MRRATRLVAIAALAPFAAPWLAFAQEPAPPVAVGVRFTQDASAAQVVFDLSRPVSAHAYALTSPDRIVVDLPEVNFQIDPAAGRDADARDAPLVKAFRFGLLAPGKSRIVIDLARPACPSPIEAKPIIDGAPASRLKIELKPCDAAAFALLDPLSAAGGAGLDAARFRRRDQSLSSTQGTAASTAAHGESAASLRRRWFTSSAANSAASSRPRTATRL